MDSAAEADVRILRAIAAVIALTGLVACSSGSGGLGSADGLLRWMTSHPDNFGLVVLRLPATEAVLSHNGDELFPLASTKKVLILGAIASAIDAGNEHLDAHVPLADIE